MKDHLVGAAEVATMLGVSRQHVSTLATAPAVGFPEPEAELSAGRIWRREAIEEWMAQNPARGGGRRPVCNFCRKGEEAVKQLVQGPQILDDEGVQTGWTAICNECIDLAATVVLKDAKDVAATLPLLAPLLAT